MQVNPSSTKSSSVSSSASASQPRGSVSRPKQAKPKALRIISSKSKQEMQRKRQSKQPASGAGTSGAKRSAGAGRGRGGTRAASRGRGGRRGRREVQPQPTTTNHWPPGVDPEVMNDSHAYVLRGIYASDPVIPPVPTFATKQEAEKWYAGARFCTNPMYDTCQHIFTTACDWQQVKQLLLPALAHARSQQPARAFAGPRAGNRFSGVDQVRVALRSRLRCPIHECTTEESTLNSLRYLFFHMRCGILVCVRGGKVQLFAPFVNKDYENTWGAKLELEGGLTVDEYYAKKRRYVREDVMPDKKKWWANGNIMCNVQSPNFWGDSYLTQMRHMLDTLCASRDVPDCEFFINKRDFPHLKKRATEAYDFLQARDDEPLAREHYASYAPMGSFFVSHEFADLPLVTTEDWETATGLVFPPDGADLRSKANRGKHQVPWEGRQPTAVFRGNSTGPGTTPATNQRLHLALVSHRWAQDPSKMDGKANAVDGKRYLDAGVVKWNVRDRKQQGQPMTYIKPDRLGFGLVPRIPMYEQVRYKYHIYVDGHCAANRYASMMPLGAVILKVASITKADHIWYFPLLVPYDIKAGGPFNADHVPVAADLSDLEEVLTWCKTHDDECQAIAKNAGAFYDRLVSKEGLLDYLELLAHEVAGRHQDHAAVRARLSVPPSTGAGARRIGAGASSAASGSSGAAMDDEDGEDEDSWGDGGVGKEPVRSTALAGSVLGDGGSDWAPSDSFDWFGASSPTYVDAKVGRSAAKLPRFVRPGIGAGTRARASNAGGGRAGGAGASASGSAPQPAVKRGGSSLVQQAQAARQKHLEQLRQRLLARKAKGGAQGGSSGTPVIKMKISMAGVKRPRPGR